MNNLDGLQLVQAVSCLNDYFLGAGGLLPRPGPEGLPVLLGQFGLLLLMMLLLCSPQRFPHRAWGRLCGIEAICLRCRAVSKRRENWPRKDHEHTDSPLTGTRQKVCS